MAIWVKMTLRLPVSVHSALTEEARKDATSLNQLIVERLNVSVGHVFVNEEKANSENVIRRLSDVERRLTELEGRKK